MADIPGQIEHLVEEDRLTNPVWYEWFLQFYRSVNGSWATFSSTTITSQGGGPPVGTVACRYRQTGRTVNVNYTITITSAVGGTGALFVPLPRLTPVYGAILTGEEVAITGQMAFGRITTGNSTVIVDYYNATSVIANGAVIILSGTYEV